MARREFGLLQYRLQGLPPLARGKLQSEFTGALLNDPIAVDTPRGPIAFVMLGEASAGRARSALTKQPATIEWIDRFQPASVFWDVGANVGVFTLYAALRADTRVIAFEPAAVNYFLLAANLEANKFDQRVDALLVGMGQQRGIARIEVSQFEAAQSFSFRGKADQQHRGRQAALVLSADELIDQYGLPCPNYIKIDVPGMTEDIFMGANRTLQRPELRELHVELRAQSKASGRIIQLLEKNGFVAATDAAHGGSADTTFVRR